MPNDTNFFWATFFILYDLLELSTGACPTPSGTEIVKTHHCAVQWSRFLIWVCSPKLVWMPKLKFKSWIDSSLKYVHSRTSEALRQTSLVYFRTQIFGWVSTVYFCCICGYFYNFSFYKANARYLDCMLDAVGEAKLRLSYRGCQRGNFLLQSALNFVNLKW